ncbi:MAG: hypothetical protein JNL82_40705 [Myxococcales bacterium]|nr:hypothetical protein [Myxococcales bacterium]
MPSFSPWLFLAFVAAYLFAGAAPALFPLTRMDLLTILLCWLAGVAVVGFIWLARRRGGPR